MNVCVQAIYYTYFLMWSEILSQHCCPGEDMVRTAVDCVVHEEGRAAMLLRGGQAMVTCGCFIGGDWDAL